MSMIEANSFLTHDIYDSLSLHLSIKITNSSTSQSIETFKPAEVRHRRRSVKLPSNPTDKPKVGDFQSRRNQLDLTTTNSLPHTQSTHNTYPITMPSIQESKLAFIGGGNMASAIIGGLLANSVPKTNITVSEPWEVNRNKLAATGVNTTTDNTVAGGSADLIIIAVKPQVTKAVCEELAKSWADRQSLPVVVSIAAGITLSSLQEWSTTPNGNRPHVVRVMPNTPALVAEGASGAIASADVSAEEKALVNELLGSVSKATEWVDKEELLDVVTGLSGKF